MRKKTTFVIGAGASREVNLPTGDELKVTIAQALNITFDSRDQKTGDYVIVQALREHVRKLNINLDIKPYLAEAWHIRDALPLAISIDNFLDSHKNNKIMELCGKLAIVRAILLAEQHSSLYFDRRGRIRMINFAALGKSWYIPFFQLLTENCRVEDLKKRLQSISLIIFNYDRCIEHFLKYAIIQYYRIPDAEAEEIVNSIEIYHPYGSVGYLPWMNQGIDMDFGVEPAWTHLLELSNQVKTFTEGTDPNSSEVMAIRKCVAEAGRVVFVGFAFHKLNMALLTPDANALAGIDPTEISCFATTSGISDSDKKVVSAQIDALYNSEVTQNLASLHAGPFFNEFRRSLSF